MIADPARTHVPALDGVRGLAVLLVVVVHAFNRGPDVVADPANLPPLIRELFRLGWVGVELFFVLSGFLITSILIQAKARSEPIGNFYIRRAARIMPAFLAVVTLVALLHLVTIHPLIDAVTRDAWDKWWWYALSINNYVGWFGVDASEAGKALGPLWSVASEQQFYLVWPLLIYAVPMRRLMQVLPVLLVANIVARVLAIQAGLKPSEIYIASLTHLDGIIIGSMLAASRERVAAWSLAASPLLLPFATLALALFFVFAGGTDGLEPMVQHYGYPLIAVYFAIVVASAASSGRVAAAFSIKPMRVLGKYSYFIYLVHWPVLLLCDQLPLPGGPLIWTLYLVAVLFGLTGLAMISWRVFERPIIEAARRYTARPTAEPATPPRGLA